MPGLYLPFWHGLWVPKAHAARRRSPSSMPRWSRRWRTRPCAERLTELGVEIPPREQQTPEALRAFLKAEIEKWWPIIEAANIKPEPSECHAESRLSIAVALIAGVASAAAQTYPNKSVTIIVPFAAGGPSDALARIMGDRMKSTLGQSFVVENVTGAAGSIARRPCGARGARRLHRQLRASRHPRRQRRDLSAALRHAHRSRAGGDAAEQSDGGGEPATRCRRRTSRS